MQPRHRIGLHLAIAVAAIVLAFPARLRSQNSHPTIPSNSVADQQEADLNNAIQTANGEPGARLHALEAFLRKYPNPAHADEIYQQLVDDATALNDDKRVLLYSEKLQQVKPGDMALRIKTLNLLLLNDDPESIAKAERYSDELLSMAAAKAKETRPRELGAARWQADIRRLQALAELLKGTAYYNGRSYAIAEQALQASLQDAQTQEAAIHLAKAYQAEGKLPQAVDAYALALALPGGSVTDHSALRQAAGTLYKQLHNGSEVGFGDLILAKFDQVAANYAREHNALTARKNANAKSAGSFVLSTLDGKSHKLDDLKGKVVVVDFWATWCGPCEVEHPILEQLEKKYSGKVAFVAINEDEDQNKVAPFLKEHHWPEDTWIDAGLSEHLGIDSLPTTLVLTPTGRIDFRLAGVDQATFESLLDSAIQRALQQG